MFKRTLITITSLIFTMVNGMDLSQEQGGEPKPREDYLTKLAKNNPGTDYSQPFYREAFLYLSECCKVLDCNGFRYELDSSLKKYGCNFKEVIYPRLTHYDSIFFKDAHIRIRTFHGLEHNSLEKNIEFLNLVEFAFQNLQNAELFVIHDNGKKDIKLAKSYVVSLTGSLLKEDLINSEGAKLLFLLFNGLKVGGSRYKDDIIYLTRDVRKIGKRLLPEIIKRASVFFQEKQVIGDRSFILEFISKCPLEKVEELQSISKPLIDNEENWDKIDYIYVFEALKELSKIKQKKAVDLLSAYKTAFYPKVYPTLLTYFKKMKDPDSYVSDMEISFSMLECGREKLENITVDNFRRTLGDLSYIYLMHMNTVGTLEGYWDFVKDISQLKGDSRWPQFLGDYVNCLQSVSPRDRKQIIEILNRYSLTIKNSFFNLAFLEYLIDIPENGRDIFAHSFIEKFSNGGSNLSDKLPRNQELYTCEMHEFKKKFIKQSQFPK